MNVLLSVCSKESGKISVFNVERTRIKEIIFGFHFVVMKTLKKPLKPF